MRELPGEGPLLGIGRPTPASSQIDIHSGHRWWHPRSLWVVRWAPSLGRASPTAAPSMELAIPAPGEAEVVQLTVAPSRQPGTGPRQGLPAGIAGRVTPAGHRKSGGPDAESGHALSPGCPESSPLWELWPLLGLAVPPAAWPSMPENDVPYPVVKVLKNSKFVRLTC